MQMFFSLNIYLYYPIINVFVLKIANAESFVSESTFTNRMYSPTRVRVDRKIDKSNWIPRLEYADITCYSTIFCARLSTLMWVTISANANLNIGQRLSFYIICRLERHWNVFSDTVTSARRRNALILPLLLIGPRVQTLIKHRFFHFVHVKLLYVDLIIRILWIECWKIFVQFE